MSRALAFIVLSLSMVLVGCPTDGGGGGADDDDDGGACSGAIPAGAEVVEGIVTANTSGGVYWVCSGGNLTVNSGNVEMYVESGGAVTGNGGEVEGYVLSGANVTINSGGGELYVEDGANFTGNSSALTVVNCATVDLDDSDAPDPGCP